MPNTNDLNIWAALPALSLALGACLLFLVDVFVPHERKHITATLACIGLVVSLLLSIPGLAAVRTTAFGGMMIADAFTALVNVINLIATLVRILAAHTY